MSSVKFLHVGQNTLVLVLLYVYYVLAHLKWNMAFVKIKLSLPGAARSEGKDMFLRYCLTERLHFFSKYV